MQHKDDNRQKEIGKQLGPELGFRYVETFDYMLLPFIFLFRMALTIKPLLVPFLVPSFHYNMFVVIGWEDYVIRRSLMMMILLLYHITINVFEVISNNISVILATISVASPWPIIKRAEYLQYTLQHSCTTKIFTKR